MASTSDLQIVRLEAAKVAAYHFQYSTEPEGTAIQKAIEWASKNGILDDVDHVPRFFGFNNPDPFRSDRKPEYGYEFWVTVSPDTRGSDGITIKTSQGGEYLALNGLGLAGWEWVKSKMGQWSKETGYEYDQSRQYLEEHVANTANFPRFDSLEGKERWKTITVCLPIKKTAAAGK